MSLPVLPVTHHTFDKTKWSPTIKFTPFNVGMESTLLQVKDGSVKEVMDAIQGIFNSCITNGVAIENLPYFVLEMLFLKMRQHSVGETINMAYRCTNPVTEGDKTNPCGEKIRVAVDIRDISIKEYPEHNQLVPITDDISIKFKYPTLDTMRSVATKDGVDESKFVIKCMESVINGDQVLSCEDESEEEISRFYSSMNILQKRDVSNIFFRTMPHINIDIEVPCGKCGFKHKASFTNLHQLFT